MRSPANDLTISTARADALFASPLQRSDEPSAEQVRRAVAGTVREFGSRACAERVAQEFGDHPEMAVARMRWALRVTSTAFASQGGPADTLVPPEPALSHTGHAA